MRSANSKIISAFVWLNWTLATLLLLLFVILSILTLRVDTEHQNKIYAILILFLSSFLPAFIFYVNGLLLKSKIVTGDEKY